MQLRIALLLFLIITSLSPQAQDSINKIMSKNKLEIEMFGNKGFISVGYNRTIFQNKIFSFTVSPAIGYVPGSHDTSNGGIPFPSFTHLNIGTDIVLGHLFNQLSAGISYSRIVLGRDPAHTSVNTKYNRVLGDISYIRHFKHDPLALKISFTPMLYDDGADDVENIPIGFTFRISL
jgi:hypothetical protein